MFFEIYHFLFDWDCFQNCIHHAIYHVHHEIFNKFFHKIKKLTKVVKLLWNSSISIAMYSTIYDSLLEMQINLKKQNITWMV